MKNPNPAAPNEVRIRKLEQQVEELTRKLAAAVNSLAIAGQVRIAEVTENPASGKDTEPIRFLRTTHDGSTATVEPRSATKQTVAAKWMGPQMPKGVRGPVFRAANGQWFWFPSGGGFGRLNESIEALDDRTDKPGSAPITVYEITSIGKIRSTGLVITVKNVFDVPIPEGSLVRFQVDWYGNALIDCCWGGSDSVSGSFSDSTSDSGAPSLPPNCVRIPGVKLDALAIVSAADVDAILAVQDGCLVAVDLAACDTGSGSV